jgi:OmpA-OmpF porin, OOP family
MTTPSWAHRLGALALALLMPSHAALAQAPSPGNAGFEALQVRLQALNERGRPLRDYHLSKAQCWLDASRHEFYRNDRSSFAREAMAESDKLVSGMESGARLDASTPLVGQAQRLRPDLWSRAAALKDHPGAACAAQNLACAEVRLVHAGHEFAQQQWRHAQPYVQMAEDLLGEAEALAKACPKPAPPAPLPPASAVVSPAAGIVVAAPALPAPVLQKLSFSADAFFDSGKALLKPEGRARLTELADKTRGINLETVIIVGHTDSDGSDAMNLKLSLRRAEAVKAFLVAQGMPAERFYSEGKGERSPVADNRTAAGKAANRRVEVEVIGARTRQ